MIPQRDNTRTRRQVHRSNPGDSADYRRPEKPEPRIRLVRGNPSYDDGGGQHGEHSGMRAHPTVAGRCCPARESGVQQTAPYI